MNSDYGVVAQLGERLLGMQKVRGSNPRSSIAKNPQNQEICGFYLMIEKMVGKGTGECYHD